MAEKNTVCPCKNHDCHRNRDCEPCKEYHHGRGSMTACERLQSDLSRTRAIKIAAPGAVWTAQP